MRKILRGVVSVLAITGLGGFAAGAVAEAPADKIASTSAAKDTAGAGQFSLQTPIEIMVEDPGARDVLDRILPGLTTHRMYETFKSMSLEALQGMAPNLLTSDRLNNVAEALAKLVAPKTN
ncbi:hypothetical protein [Sulfuritalea hydrogenivorans]|uniref:hypothetical protein n=1 Tax=Sulfuritalea hydrogenivorans TaxID=748811 RepID=UPI00069669AD|nr:hypothetical protein [Sulfuritalea hydrogenivorans]